MISSESICIFPLGHVVFTLHDCKGKSHTLTSLPGACCATTAAKCIVGLTWCSEEVKQLMDIWRQMRTCPRCRTPNTKTATSFLNCEWMNETEKLWSLCRAVLYEDSMQHIKVWDHIYIHKGKWSFGVCSLAAHVKSICSSCWVSCVEPLQGLSGTELRVEIKPSQRGNTPFFQNIVLKKAPFIYPLCTNQDTLLTFRNLRKLLATQKELALYMNVSL